MFVKPFSTSLLFPEVDHSLEPNPDDKKWGNTHRNTIHQVNFTLFLKMNMLCFYFNPQDRACPF